MSRSGSRALLTYTSDVDPNGHTWKLVRAKKPKEVAGDAATHNIVKLTFLGESAVGKTALMKRFCEMDADRKSAPTLVTVCPDFAHLWLKSMHPNYNETTRLQLVDTAGQERYRSVAPSVFNSANGVFLVFDSTREKTFELLCSVWAPMVRKFNPYCLMALVATKFDLYQALPPEQRWMDAIDMRAQAEQLDCKGGFHIVSAVTGQHVDAMVVQMVDASIDEERQQYAAVSESRQRRDGLVLIGNNITVRKTCSC